MQLQSHIRERMYSDRKNFCQAIFSILGEGILVSAK